MSSVAELLIAESGGGGGGCWSAMTLMLSLLYGKNNNWGGH